MRGEFLGVWEDTYREIWTPLAQEEGVPDDVFSQLYRELAVLLRDPAGDEALALPLNDAIQLRLAFDRALALGGIEIELQRANEAFEASGATSLTGTLKRRVAVEAALSDLIGDPVKGAHSLGVALTELAGDPKRRAEAKERAIDAIVNDTGRSRAAFVRVRPSDLVGERSLIRFLEAAFAIFDDLGGDELSNRYFNLLADFIEKFSLRYDLRRPCSLSPTLPGIFASLVRDLERLARLHPNIARRLRDFNESVHDLRLGPTEGRISTCIAKQVMLLEALGATDGDVTATELAGICKQIESWPHSAVRPALLGLYGFACDYSGVRHGTESEGKRRDLEVRDLVAISILLAGFAPYLSGEFDADVVYRGA